MSGRLFFWINHTCQHDKNTGVQRVTRSLATALEQLDADLVYVKWEAATYSPTRAEPRDLEVLSHYSGPKVGQQISAPGPLHLNGIDDAELEGSWLLVPEVSYFGTPSRMLTADLIDYCRSKKMKVAFVFYDLIPMILPGYEDARGGHEDYVQHLALADLIIPISEYVAEALRNYLISNLGLSPSAIPKISPIPLGEAVAGERRFSHNTVSRSGRRRIVCLGTVEPRKNQLRLLRAFASVCDTRDDLELHIVGHMHPGVADEFFRLCSANPRVKYHRYLPDRQTEELIHSADFTIFPSVEEGYGLPIIESLWLGRPVICANFGAMAEVAAGGGSWTINTTSEDEIVSAIDKLASDSVLLERLVEGARNRTFKSWKTYAEQIQALLRSHVPLRRVWCFVDRTVRTPFNTGIQRVTRALGRAFQEIGVEAEFVAWDSALNRLREVDDSEATQLAKWHGPAARMRGQFDPAPDDWLIVPEILLSPGPSLAAVIDAARAFDMKVCVILYDLIPLKLSSKWPTPPEEPLYSRDVASAYEVFWRDAACADAILPISKTVDTDLREYFKRTLRKQMNLNRCVVPATLGGDFTGEDRVVGPHPSGQFTMTAVGTVEPRKNYSRLIEAFQKASGRPGAPAMKLNIVGSQQSFPELADQLRKAAQGTKSIEFVEHADDRELRELIRQASVTIYASYEEGFGLPIIESLWFGRACICHNQGALAETATGGGVQTVDMLDVEDIANAIYQLAIDPYRLTKLTSEAQLRHIKTWTEYSREIASILSDLAPPSKRDARKQHAFLPTPIATLKSPILSICVVTFNRANWLKRSLQRVLDLSRPYRDVVEIVVCDNGSTDDTADVAAALLRTEHFEYFRIAENVGVLEGFAPAARHASGEYVWLLGDDDILIPGSIENILTGILDHPNSELVYLNYAQADFNGPDVSDDLAKFVAQSRAVADGGPNRWFSQLRQILSVNESFMTVSSACILRRNHAIRAYTQNAGGRPFSSLQTSAPSAVYGMEMMLDLPVYWVGVPSVVINKHTPWQEWELLWHLERMPELYDWAERVGMAGQNVDRHRWSHAADAAGLIRQVYFSASEVIRAEFDIERYIARTMHLEAFRKSQIDKIREVYLEAYEAGRLNPEDLAPDALFDSFRL